MSETKDTLLIDPRLSTEEITGPNPMSKCANWNDWFQEWKMGTYYQRLSLLDVGLVMPRSSHELLLQQLRFYLTLSDKEVARELQQKHGSDWARLSHLATLALIRDLFTSKTSSDYDPSWAWLLDSEETFETMLWYFRPRFCNMHVGIGAIENVAPSEGKETLSKFLRTFCQLAWSERKQERRPWLAKSLPRLVPVLCGLGGEAIWEAANPTNGTISFDDTCLDTLRQVALSIKIWDHEEGDHILPGTIGKAVSHGTEAARVYLVLQKIKNEEKKVEDEKKRLARMAELREELERLEKVPSKAEQ